MRLYTRTGDEGLTRLFGGASVGKDDARLEAYGTVDELNSAIGMLRAMSDDPEIDRMLEEIQRKLFELSAHLANPDSEEETVTDANVRSLETRIDEATRQCPELTQFILPGGSPAAAAAHLARTICRRSERRVVALIRTGAHAPKSLQYLNRLSDFLFAAARLLNVRAGVPETTWRQPGSATDEASE